MSGVYRAWNGALYEGSPPEGWVEIQSGVAGEWWPAELRDSAESRREDRRRWVSVLAVLAVLGLAWIGRDLRTGEFLVLYLALSVPVGLSIGTGLVMRAKGFDAVAWGLIGLVLPVLGLVAAFAMPRRVRAGLPPHPGRAAEPAMAASPSAPVAFQPSPVPVPPATHRPRPEARPAWWSGLSAPVRGGLAGMAVAAVVLSAGALAWSAWGAFGPDDSTEVAGVQVTTTVLAELEDQEVSSTTSTTEELVEESSVPTAASGLPTEDAEVLPFRQMHERRVGLVGAGWNISIDEVRPGELSQWADESYTGGCTVVIGTAVLREWEGEGLTSNPFSFPSINLIDQDARVDVDSLTCDLEPLRGEGLTRRLDVEIVEGAEVRWFDVWPTAVSGEYQAVAVEQTLYTPSGS